MPVVVPSQDLEPRNPEPLMGSEIPWFWAYSRPTFRTSKT